MSRARVRSRKAAVLDNEALQALADITHGKHRRMLFVLEVDARLNGLGQGGMQIVAPVAVRIEAGVARSGPAAKWPGLSTVVDVELSGPAADRALDLRRRAEAGSVVDATVAEVADRYAGEGWATTVYTSDVTDLSALTAASDNAARIGVVRV